MYLTETNDYYFDCPKLGSKARITEIFWPAEIRKRPSFRNVSCSGSYSCGI